MLKQRILTALVLIPLLVALVILLPMPAFCIMTAIVTLLGAWEWSRLMGIRHLLQRAAYLIIMTAALVAALWFKIPTTLYVAAVWWLFAAMLVMLYPKAAHLWSKGVIIRGLMGFLVLIPCWLAINFIRSAESGIYSLLFLFVLIWGADSGAYFVGRKWGTLKLAPAVSPGKSWQGVLGAFFTTLFIVLAMLWLRKFPSQLWFGVCLLSIVTVIFSILGDLFESMLKRNEGVKDSGNLLPGHG